MFEIQANERHKMTIYSWKVEAPVHIFHILTSRQKTKPTQLWLIYFREGKVKVWWEEKRFPWTTNLKTKMTLLFSCWLGNSHFSIFLEFFYFPKGFQLLFKWKVISQFSSLEYRSNYIKIKNVIIYTLSFLQDMEKDGTLSRPMEASRKVTNAQQKTMMPFFFLLCWCSQNYFHFLRNL